MKNDPSKVYKKVKEYSAPFDSRKKNLAIILAAGHGKRIKSNTSKMLHKIFEVPTVKRVCNACEIGLQDFNSVVVVGIKAEEVIESIGKQKNISFAYQEVQLGTGHAVQIALKDIPKDYDGTVFILLGDMGLLDGETINSFEREFKNSNADMMVLTGLYEGTVENNYYGRIVRAQKNTAGGKKSKLNGKVIEILEYKDILNLDKKKPYVTNCKNEKHKFSRAELLENREFNSGVFAFKAQPLLNLINKIENKNVQKEIYLTDLISLFNQNGYIVEAVSPKEQHVLMGFNNKSVLTEMDTLARKLVYDKIKDAVLIEDPHDFFVHEKVAEEIIERDKNGEILDIEIGKGSYVGEFVSIGFNVRIGRNVKIDGFVQLENNISIDSFTNIYGTEKHPTKIEDNVLINGGCVISCSLIGSDSMVEYSIIDNKRLKRKSRVKYYKPETVGKKFISNR